MKLGKSDLYKLANRERSLVWLRVKARFEVGVNIVRVEVLKVELRVPRDLALTRLDLVLRLVFLQCHCEVCESSHAAFLVAFSLYGVLHFLIKSVILCISIPP